MNVNLDRIRLLVADLRTPGILQGHGYLTQETVDPDTGEPRDEDCRLGRACKVAIANGIENLDIRRGDAEHVAYVYPRIPVASDDEQGYEASEMAVLPPPVRDWFGFNSDDPNLLLPNGVTHGAIGLNDDKCWTFDQIATAFEVTFLGGTYPPEAMTWREMPLADPAGMLEP